MKLAFLVGSVINVSEGTFNYMENSRSAQSSDERARQTAVTLNSIFCKYPNAKIYLIEGSLSLPKELLVSSGIFYYLEEYNVELVKLVDIDKDVCKELNTHENKSYCECLLYSTFLKHYEEDLENYDLVIKLTGRYSITSNFNIDSSMTKDDILFKHIHKFDNPDNIEWAYSDLLIPGQKLTDACYTFSMTYAFGGNRIDDFKHFLEFTMENTKNNGREIEMLIQYWSWKNRIKHKEMNWYVCGYAGSNNKRFIHA